MRQKKLPDQARGQEQKKGVKPLTQGHNKPEAIKNKTMQIELSEIKKFKTNNWLDKKKLAIVYGIQVVMSDGKSYNCLRTLGKPIFYDNKADAIKEVKKLNKELNDERSVASKEPQTTKS